jgi:asparagine synthase (glutamine-hydrolysing)
MCGIAGIVGALDPGGADMRAMLRALVHRGPDGEGIFADSQATLGHRRLSIIDIAGGRQPLHNVEKTIWLVCNGEIYNYHELRASLAADGHRFVTNSDCEVIIGLYERYGDGLLDHLRGMFAFALWDTRKQRLLAARDHLGQKPFFYIDQPDRFAFGSEIKSLLALDPALRVLNLQALEQYLALRLIGPPLTMFKDVRKLPPGHLLTVERGARPKIRAYWDLKFEPKIQGSEESLIDELEERICESLRLHMVSDVRVGAFLSGGLDSSLLVAMLAKRVGVKDLPTFTIGLPYQRFDEAPYARSVAEMYGTEHHERTITLSLTGILPDLIYHLDEPSDPLSLCAYQVARFARETVKAATAAMNCSAAMTATTAIYTPDITAGCRRRSGAACSVRRCRWSPPRAGTRARAINCGGCTACRSYRAVNAMRRACRIFISTAPCANNYCRRAPAPSSAASIRSSC